MDTSLTYKKLSCMKIHYEINIQLSKMWVVETSCFGCQLNMNFHKTNRKQRLVAERSVFSVQSQLITLLFGQCWRVLDYCHVLEVPVQISCPFVWLEGDRVGLVREHVMLAPSDTPSTSNGNHITSLVGVSETRKTILCMRTNKVLCRPFGLC